MILVPIDSVQEGMVLGRSVFADNGDLLLAAGYRIKPIVLKRLREMRLGTIWIHQEGTEDVVPQEIIDEQVSRQADAALMDATDVIGKSLKIREETMDDIEKNMKKTDRFKNIIAVPRVQKAVGDIIDSILSQADVVVGLSTMRSQKTYLYRHAVETTVIALLIGSKLRLTREELNELGMGCILHDIGMSVLPEKLVTKAGRLTYQEFSMVKEHPTFGYAILKENSAIAPTSCHIAFQHHERQDGFGYPRKLRGNNLLPIKTLKPEKGYMHRYAEIAAVADAYDAMASPRQFTQQRAPDEIIKQLILAAGNQLNRSIVDVFVGLIPVFPVGSFVTIAEAKMQRLVGLLGVVAQTHKEQPGRPLIVVVKNEKKESIKPFKIDLLQQPDIKIQFVPLRTFAPQTG